MLFGDRSWSATIGDPSFGGWFAVVAYFATAWLCVFVLQAESNCMHRKTRQNRSDSGFRFLLSSVKRIERRQILWMVFGVAMFALGVNKQLDLQTLFTNIGRDLAKSGGWYESRKTVQVIFIATVTASGVVGIVSLQWLTRGDRSLLMPLVGLAFVVCFVVLRAASFHGFDKLISLSFLKLRVNWILEFTGIGLIAYGALRHLKRH